MKKKLTVEQEIEWIKARLDVIEELQKGEA